MVKSEVTTFAGNPEQQVDAIMQWARSKGFDVQAAMCAVNRMRQGDGGSQASTCMEFSPPRELDSLGFEEQAAAPAAAAPPPQQVHADPAAEAATAPPTPGELATALEEIMLQHDLFPDAQPMTPPVPAAAAVQHVPPVAAAATAPAAPTAPPLAQLAAAPAAMPAAASPACAVPAVPTAAAAAAVHVPSAMHVFSATAAEAPLAKSTAPATTAKPAKAAPSAPAVPMAPAAAAMHACSATAAEAPLAKCTAATISPAIMRLTQAQQAAPHHAAATPAMAAPSAPAVPMDAAATAAEAPLAECRAPATTMPAMMLTPAPQVAPDHAAAMQAAPAPQLAPQAAPAPPAAPTADGMADHAAACSTAAAETAETAPSPTTAAPAPEAVAPAGPAAATGAAPAAVAKAPPAAGVAGLTATTATLAGAVPAATPAALPAAQLAADSGCEPPAATPGEAEALAAHEITPHTHAAESMRLLRLARNAKRLQEVSPQLRSMLQTDEGRRNALTVLVRDCAGDMALLNLTMQRTRAHVQCALKKKEAVTRAQLLLRYGDPAVVDRIIAVKLANGQCEPDPDNMGGFLYHIQTERSVTESDTAQETMTLAGRVELTSDAAAALTGQGGAPRAYIYMHA